MARLRNPIHLADRFLAELAAGDVSQAQVAKRHGLSGAAVSYHLALVKRLPSEFVEWLRAARDPRILRALSERRLRAVARIQDPTKQRAELDALVGAALEATEARRPAAAMEV